MLSSSVRYFSLVSLRSFLFDADLLRSYSFQTATSRLPRWIRSRLLWTSCVLRFEPSLVSSRPVLSFSLEPETDLAFAFLFSVPVVDSFALSDHIINSPLGRYDGDVYQAYFDQVRRANPLPKGTSSCLLPFSRSFSTRR